MSNALKVLTVSTLSVLALVASGCTSSTTGSTTPYSSTSISGCTQTSGTETQTCIPTLGNYGTDITYAGTIDGTADPELGTALLRSFLNAPNFSPPLADVEYPTVTINLQATTTGPLISTTIYIDGYVISNGESTFTPGTSNPSAGTIEFDPFGTQLTPVDFISPVTPWDGSSAYMIGITVKINDQTFGTVSLQQVANASNYELHRPL